MSVLSGRFNATCSSINTTSTFGMSTSTTAATLQHEPTFLCAPWIKRCGNIRRANSQVLTARPSTGWSRPAATSSGEQLSLDPVGHIMWNKVQEEVHELVVANHDGVSTGAPRGGSYP